MDHKTPGPTDEDVSILSAIAAAGIILMVCIIGVAGIVHSAIIAGRP